MHTRKSFSTTKKKMKKPPTPLLPKPQANPPRSEFLSPAFSLLFFLAKLQLCLVAGKVKENQSKKRKKEKKEKEKGTACLAAGSLGLKCWKILESHS